MVFIIATFLTCFLQSVWDHCISCALKIVCLNLFYVMYIKTVENFMNACISPEIILVPKG